MKNVTTKIYIICTVVLLTGVIISLVTYFGFESANNIKRDKILSGSFNNIQDQIEREIERNLNSLYALRANYMSHGGFSRNEFQSYASYYTSKIKSIQALEWVPVIKQHQRDSFELATRKEGFENFQITTKVGDSLVRAETRAVYYPVYFIAPLEGNESAFGYDPGPAIEVRQAAIDRAIETQRAATSNVMSTIQRAEPHKAILVFVPIFKEGKKGAENVIGLIEGVYLMNRLIESALQEIDLNDTEVIIKSKDAEGELLFGEPNTQALTNSNSRSGELTMADSSWDLQMIYYGDLGLPIIKPIWILIVALAITFMIVKIVFDVLTDNRRTLQKHVKSLEQKNQDLERYAYVASHDLQEPLHSMQSLVNLLDLEYKDKFDEKGQQYMQYILASSNRMSSLITNLLKHSRIGFDEAIELVDCNVVLERVIQDLDQTIKKANAQIRIKKSLPTIKAYPSALHQLFQNLISNAIKFQSRDNQPEIEISSEFKNNQWQFMFKDNGIGIPKASQKQIFVIFKRLHNSSVFAGTGVGLANCKKIVDIHNGEIWVESEQNKGSTFFFTMNLNKL
ncbi:MAG TPA: CHASE domain-containing protein [Fulvivirga sp.]|nr:CHASE domain-containing protein [Fulvivirga sp.]